MRNTKHGPKNLNSIILNQEGIAIGKKLYCGETGGWEGGDKNMTREVTVQRQGLKKKGRITIKKIIS